VRSRGLRERGTLRGKQLERANERLLADGHAASLRLADADSWPRRCCSRIVGDYLLKRSGANAYEMPAKLVILRVVVNKPRASLLAIDCIDSLVSSGWTLCTAYE
jgi:hypothetical protein